MESRVKVIDACTRFAGLALLGLLSTSSTKAASYQLTIESPRVVPEPLLAFPLAPLDLGTRVSSVEHVSLQISGVHSNGWWIGDGIIDDYVGPLGAKLTVYLFTASDIEIPGLAPEGWYKGACEITNDGEISVDLTLRPSPRSLVGVPYVADGRVALCCVTWARVGFGSMARQPYLELSRVEISMVAEPILEITSIRADGTVTWSALPAGGTIELLVSSGPEGPWEVVSRLPSETVTVVVPAPEPGASRFVRLRWQESLPPFPVFPISESPGPIREK
jgi:hypothetical protein